MPAPPELALRRAQPNLCAAYTVRSVPVNDAGGDECDLTQYELVGKFERQDSQISTASITMALVDEGCCDCLPTPWEDYIVIDRVTTLGIPEGNVWWGIVTATTEDTSGSRPAVTIEASDLSVWWARRSRARTAISGVMDEAHVWAAIVADAESGDPSGLQIGAPEATGVEVAADYIAAAADHPGTDTFTSLYGSALPSVQWTVTGRRLWGPRPYQSATSSEIVARLDTERDWVVPGSVVDVDGSDLTAQVRFYRPEDDGSFTVGVWPPDSAVDRSRGVHIATLEIDNQATQAGLVALARQRYEADRDPHVFVVSSSDSLSQDAPVTIWDLIPGELFSLSSEQTCELVVDQPLRLYSVVVDFDGPGGVPATEARVAPDFGPPGRDSRSSNRASV